MTYDKIKLSGFKVQNASGVLGRCFIEVDLSILFSCILVLKMKCLCLQSHARFFKFLYL